MLKTAQLPLAAIARRHPGILAGFLGLLAAQGGFWAFSKDIKPQLGIVPDVPRLEAVQALSLGDPQLYFRALALVLQNTGDTYGRFTSLKEYDYSKVAQWMYLLDGLDARSDMVPSMAAYYYSNTQNTPDVRYLVDYLYAHASRDIAHKWWWLIQAIYLAMHKLQDNDLAMKVAAPLNNDAVPVWARQMVAVVHEKRGEMEDALQIMLTIQKNTATIEDKDLRYMRYFIDERLKKLEEFEKLSGKKLPDFKNEPPPAQPPEHADN